MRSAKRISDHLENLFDMEKGFTFDQAIAEADRCLLCHDAPCSRDCPAGTDPGTFIRKLRFRNIRGGIRTIKNNNVLGGICGVLCPTDRLCEKGCSATELDRPIRIGELQRFLVEYGWNTGFDPIEKSNSANGKVAIVGSGPAGLSCAAELAKEGVEAVVFEAKEKPGGVLRYGVPEFRLNSEMLDRELKDVTGLGVTIKCGNRVGKEDVDRLLEDGFDAVFLAPGIWKPKRQDIPGVELDNVLTSTEFLEGARTDKREEVIELVRGKQVAITGGGSVAMDVASTCAAMKAHRVHVIYRRGFREMPADDEDVVLARANYVIIRPFSVVTELIGDNGKLVGLRGIGTDWIEPGRFTSDNLRTVPGTEFSLNADLFVMAIGTGPESGNIGLSSGVGHSVKGFIKTADDGVSTTQANIFAGGDIIRGPGLVVEAVNDGKRAAGKIGDLILSRGGG